MSNEFVAVTGTNGKTTTVELIGHIHREAGLPVAVAGNVGVAVSGLVGNVEERVVIVCEVSSFQLEDTIAFAPEAAVLLNVAPDHLDRHGTFAAYTAAKLEIFARQGNEDIAVVPAKLRLDFERPPNFASDPPANLAVAPRFGAARRVTFGVQPDSRGGPRSMSVTLRAGVICWQGAPLLRAEEIALRGRHNVENAMAAAAVCLARGVEADAVRAGLRSFAGVAHRLEEVAHRDGVLYVNDSKATNVASTLVALDAFPAGAVHLILGGQAKGQDFSALRAPVERSCRAVYLIGEDAPALSAALKGVGVPVHECGESRASCRPARGAAEAWGGGAAVAGLRELRPVRRLRSPRRALS